MPGETSPPEPETITDIARSATEPFTHDMGAERDGADIEPIVETAVESIQSDEFTEVQVTLETLADNGLTDTDKLYQVARHMASLMAQEMSPSAARVSAVYSVVDGSVKDKAEYLDMTKGGFASLRVTAEREINTAKTLALANIAGPVSILADFTLNAEPPADYKERYVLFEVVSPREEWSEEQIFDRRGPDVRRVPPEPKYGLVIESRAHPRAFNPDDDPEDREYMLSTDRSTVWFMDSDEMTDYLYDDEYFFTIHRAEQWQGILEELGMETDSDPEERLHPDARQSE